MGKQMTAAEWYHEEQDNRKGKGKGKYNRNWGQKRGGKQSLNQIISLKGQVRRLQRQITMMEKDKGKGGSPATRDNGET